MKLLILIALLISSLFSLDEDFEIKENGRPEKKLKKQSKILYIQDFTVNYQIELVMAESQQGGHQLGGGVQGNTAASLAVAIADLDNVALQKVTDSLYSKYLNEMKRQGFEIVDLDEIWESKLYTKKREKRWNRKTNEGMYTGGAWGNVVSKPTGFEFIEPKSKNGFFTNIVLGKTPYELNLTTNIVYLNVSIFKDAESGFSKFITDLAGTSNIEIETDFRINENSAINFNNLIFFRPEDLNLGGVIEDQEFESFQTADRDLWGTDYRLGTTRRVWTIYSAENLEKNNAYIAKCDPKKYVEGADFGLNIFMDSTLVRIDRYLKD